MHNWKGCSRRSFMNSMAMMGAASTLKPKPAQAQARPDNLEVGNPNGMNIIVIIADTWRWDYLGCAGNRRINTPNLDALAEEGVYFRNCYADGLPTIPARRVMHTGMSILPEREKWVPLRKGYQRGNRERASAGLDHLALDGLQDKTDSFEREEDIMLSEILGMAGFTTGFIVDTFHHFKPDMNFHNGFDSFQWIRGQEVDRWVSGPRHSVHPEQHCPPHLLNDTWRENMTQYLLNTKSRTSEDDYFSARSCSAALEWIEANRDNDGPFMLFLDMFTPHEPWDAPERFQKMYRDSYPYERYLFGYGVDTTAVRDEDIPVLTDLYSAEVSFSDYCIGKLVEGVKQLGLWDNTIIAFSTDHGTHLGEQGCVQKQAKLLNSLIARVPLIIRHPDTHYRGKRIDALTGHIDFVPTFLSLLGVDTNLSFHGKNMWDLVTGREEKLRDYAITGYSSFGSVHTRKWHYFQNVWGNNTGLGPQLNNLEQDPDEEVNVVREHPETVSEMKEVLSDSFGVKLS